MGMRALPVAAVYLSGGSGGSVYLVILAGPDAGRDVGGDGDDVPGAGGADSHAHVRHTVRTACILPRTHHPGPRPQAI